MSRLDHHTPGVKGRQRQQQILEAAADLFAAHGYEKTTTQDIAQAVGVLKGSLYYYFNSKEELLFQIISANHEALHRFVVADVDYTAVEGLEKIHLFTTRHIRFVLTHRAVSALYSQEIDVVRAVESWWHAIAEARREHEQFLVELIRQSQSRGDASPLLDPTLSGRAILSMANSTLRWFREGDRHEIEDVVAHHATLATNGLRT